MDEKLGMQFGDDLAHMTSIGSLSSCLGPVVSEPGKTQLCVYNRNTSWSISHKTSTTSLEPSSLQREVLGPEQLHAICTKSSIGAKYGMWGRYRKAEKIFLSLISSDQDTVGKSYPDTIITMHNLAATFYSQEYYDQTEK